MSNLLALLAVVLTLHFAQARAPYAFSFPRDHYAHDAYRTEWWYFTGHLRARDGRRYGYELTFFRFGLEPHARRLARGQSEWRAAQLYPAHFALTDESGKRFISYQTLAREALGAGAASEDRLRVRANGWSLDGAPSREGKIAMHLRASRPGYALDLEVLPQKRPAIHGSGGVSRKGPCASCASHYYSFTDARARGHLTFAGSPVGVSGSTWMDHEFGSSELLPSQSGWDWFALQLYDGREAMLYRLRQRDGSVTPQSSGSLVERNGNVRRFSFAQCEYRELAAWHSPHTGATYPSQWLMRVPGIRNELRVVPALSDQELVDPLGQLTYWEGSAAVFDAKTGVRTGDAYVELTGYVSKLSL